MSLAGLVSHKRLGVRKHGLPGCIMILMAMKASMKT